MRVLVCVKEVHDVDPDVELKIDDQQGWIEEDDSTRFIMNRYDEFAVEEALLIKEQWDDVQVDAVTVGPERSENVLRRAMGMGVDHGIHILSNQPGLLDPFQLSGWIASWARDRNYDLVFTGVMSEDAQQAQTGVLIAQRLCIPWATAVVSKNLSEDRKTVSVQRELEGGVREEWSIPLPCLLTLQSGINLPRYPALSKVLKAKKAELETIPVEQLEQTIKGQQIVRCSYPQKQRSGTVIEGSSRDKARQLLSLLEEKSFLR